MGRAIVVARRGARLRGRRAPRRAATCSRRASRSRCSTAPTSRSSSRRRLTRRRTCSAAWRPDVRWCAAPPDGTRRAPRWRRRCGRSSGALLWAPNFSIGVHLFARIVEHAARLVVARRTRGFDAHLVETHHDQKLDAPSGTARAARRPRGERAAGKPMPITSVRVGSVPGTHEVDLRRGVRADPARARRARPARVRGRRTRRGHAGWWTGRASSRSTTCSGAPT